MSKKVLDQKGRFRNKLISFRMSPEESKMLNRKVALAGISKHDYIINSILNKEIIVEPSPFVIRSIKRELDYKIETCDDKEMLLWIKEMLMAFNGNKKTKVKPTEVSRQ